jgi:pimeloyl-ACP methyl ester carboxylesterase
MTRLRKGGDELAWTDIGPLDGNLVVCCHGAGYDGSTFAGLAAALAAEGLRVVLPDNRGAGASTDHDGLIARQAHIRAIDHRRVVQDPDRRIGEHPQLWNTVPLAATLGP